MKVRDTQRLFWKQWPYKAIIKIRSADRSATPYINKFGNMMAGDRLRNQQEFGIVERWCKSHFPTAGIRKEVHLSIFLSTQEELDILIDYYGERILEIWKPSSDAAKELLIEHTYDIVRNKLWYDKFPIRARISYNREFKASHLESFKQAVLSIERENWHAAGLLKEVIELEKPSRAYGWGQPLHLYLASADDAAMLRLMCGSGIDRFERVRTP